MASGCSELALPVLGTGGSTRFAQHLCLAWPRSSSAMPGPSRALCLVVPRLGPALGQLGQALHVAQPYPLNTHCPAFLHARPGPVARHACLPPAFKIFCLEASHGPATRGSAMSAPRLAHSRTARVPSCARCTAPFA